MTERPDGGSRVWCTLFEWALKIYPVEWRDRYRDEARTAFRDGLESRPNGWGRRGRNRYAFQVLADALRQAARERRRGRSGSPRHLSDDLVRDLHHGARRLRRSPRFTLTALTLMALGIGVNAALFTVLRKAALESLPYPGAERLVIPRWGVAPVGEASRDTIYWPWSHPRYLDFREGNDLLEEVAGFARRTAAVTEPGAAESVPFEFTTASYLSMLGAVPILGRLILPEDDDPLDPRFVAVISHGMWTSRFGADPEVIGRTLEMEGHRLAVIGVLAEGFRGLTGATEFWVPLTLARHTYGEWATEYRGTHWFQMLARLPEGVRPAAAEERLEPLWRAVDEIETVSRTGGAVSLQFTLVDEVRISAETRAAIWVSVSAAVLVLLIAMANLAALTLARRRRDRHEVQMRLALGAGRWRLVREAAAESLLLSGAGAVAGILCAAWTLRLLQTGVPDYIFHGMGGAFGAVTPESFALDFPVVALGVAVAIVTGLLAGVLPMAGSGELDPAGGLRGAVDARSRTVARAGFSRWVVGSQVAMSVILLVGAGLLLSTLRELHKEQRGFEPEGLVAFRYNLQSGGTLLRGDAARDFHRRLRDRVATLPGVASAAFTTTPPLSGHYIRTDVNSVVGEAPFDPAARPRVGIHFSDARAFATQGSRILSGRGFSEAEFEGAEPVAVINETAAERFFAGDPIGRALRVGFAAADTVYPYRIVGIVEDVLYMSPTEGVIPEMYLPIGHFPPSTGTLMVRAEIDASLLISAVRETLAGLDSEIPFWSVRTGEELRANGVTDTRLLVWLLGIFAGLAVVLAATGLWAVVAQAVGARRREIGVRVALGARAVDVEVLVFREGLLPIVGGGVAGLLLALLTAPRLSALLFGVEPRDPAVLVGAAAVLVAVALLATWLPARRAARVDPVEALASD